VTSTGFIDSAEVGPTDIPIAGMNVKPALGLAWSHCINTRIMLYRDYADFITKTDDRDDDNLQLGMTNQNEDVLQKENYPSFMNYESYQSNRQEKCLAIKSNRLMSVMFSPLTSSNHLCSFEIDFDGVKGVEILS
jgi:hypothetical protein